MIISWKLEDGDGDEAAVGWVWDMRPRDEGKEVRG
jgi:hypothetical protein